MDKGKIIRLLKQGIKRCDTNLVEQALALLEASVGEKANIVQSAGAEYDENLREYIYAGCRVHYENHLLMKPMKVEPGPTISALSQTIAIYLHAAGFRTTGPLKHHSKAER